MLFRVSWALELCALQIFFDAENITVSLHQIYWILLIPYDSFNISLWKFFVDVFEENCLKMSFSNLWVYEFMRGSNLFVDFFFLRLIFKEICVMFGRKFYLDWLLLRSFREDYGERDRLLRADAVTFYGMENLINKFK